MARLVDISRGVIAGMAPTPVEQYAIDNYFVNDELFNAIEFMPIGAAGSLGNIQASYVAYGDGETGADFRNIGEEYDPSVAVGEIKVVQLRNLGGAYPVDRTTTRALVNGGIDVYREQQAAQKSNQIKNAFAKNFISGDSSTNPKAFNGVYKTIGAGQISAALDLGPTLTADKAIEAEMYFNDTIALMNVTPNYVMTTRKGASFAKTINAMRNYGTAAVEVDSVKYNQLMGINLIQVPDSYFPADQIAKGLPFIFMYLSPEPDGIKVAIPCDGKVIDIIEPELGDGTLVKNGAMEIICTPYFTNAKSVAVGYIDNSAV